MIALSYVSTTEEETTYFRLLKVLKSFEASMASKQPRRSHLKSDFKLINYTTYATKFVWNVLTFFDHFDRRKKKEERRKQKEERRKKNEERRTKKEERRKGKEASTTKKEERGKTNE